MRDLRLRTRGRALRRLRRVYAALPEADRLPWIKARVRQQSTRTMVEAVVKRNRH